MLEESFKTIQDLLLKSEVVKSVKFGKKNISIKFISEDNKIKFGYNSAEYILDLIEVFESKNK